jgi:translocation and assembly module TamB
MSDDPKSHDDQRQPTSEPLHSDAAGKHLAGKGALSKAVRTVAATVKRRSLAWHITRAGAWCIGGALALVILLLASLTWYTTTANFQHRASREIVYALENATGGRVEVRAVHLSLWQLKIAVDGLVIHGTEVTGEAPFLAVERVEVRVGIGSFFARATGIGGRSRVGLRLLRVERPQLHLMVNKDGRTNLPVPKHPSTNNEPLVDQLLDLRVRQLELVEGVALVNDRAVPFDLAARNLDAAVRYLRATDRYWIGAGLNDLRTKIDAQSEAHSRLSFKAELGRDAVDLTGLEFDSGAASEPLTLHIAGVLTNFAQPQWQFALNGAVDLKQLSVLTDVEGFTGGAVDLTLSGHSCAASPVAVQAQPTKPRFWQRKQAGSKPTARSVVDPECKAGYMLTGAAKLHKAGFVNQYVILHDVDGSARIHITPSELLLTEMNGLLPGGGSAAGELRFADWLGGAAHAYLTSTVTRLPLRTIMEVTETSGYGDLGFDTAVTGPVKVEWGGQPTHVGDTVIVDGQLVFQPTGMARRGALNNVPVSGVADARYEGKHETVNIRRTLLQTPGSTTEATGILGVEDGDPLTGLHVDTTIRDLSEFDQLLQTLGFNANGKKGRAAIPVDLHGGLTFHGTASGPANDLDVKGHVQGSQIEARLGSDLGFGQDTLIDSLAGDAEYSYDEGLSIANSTIHRGASVLNVTGSLHPRKVILRQATERRMPVVDYLWDKGTSIDATVKLANAESVDVLQIVGLQQKVPLTGKIATTARLGGTLGDLDGTGKLSLARGVAWGEPYDSAVAEVAMHGQQIDANNAVLILHGASITGNGGYDVQTKRVHGHIEGDNLVLSKFQAFAKTSPNANGTLTIVADANGTIEQPGLKATARLAGVTLNGKVLGEVDIEAHSESSELAYTLRSTLVGAKIDATGQTQMTGDYQTQARLAFTGFDIGTPLGLFAPGGVKAQSSISGIVSVNGPLQTPVKLSGAAELSTFDVKLEGVELKAAEPLRVSLRNGMATLDQVHIVGQDTNMQASGTAQIFGSTDPAGGQLNLRASGSVSVAIAHTFDPDILSNGRVEFTLAAGGRIDKPSLTGRVRFNQVNLAMDGIPNGLSSLNGTLVFNEDRLEVENLTALTGGGQLKIGGFLTYRNGVYADLTASGEVVRVRFEGLSATGNTSLRLQGGPQSLLLSGTVLVTRFGIGPDMDFASFAGAGGVSSPPDPSAASNKIRLDVHVISSPQLDFQNSYAKLAGTADLTVRGTVAIPTILGRIQITDGSATFAGTKYQLQRGSIYFTNPVRIDPTVDVDATAHVESYDITVGLQGTMSNLKSSYRSEPPLSEADIFALLALGRTQEEAQLYQEQQVEAGSNSTSSALLGGALNETVGSRIGKLFGGGSVKIDPAFVGTLGNSSARITVQQQISHQLSVIYATNVNYTAQQLLQAQYDITPNASIVLTRDESGVYSVVYKIRRRYR